MATILEGSLTIPYVLQLHATAKATFFSCWLLQVHKFGYFVDFSMWPRQIYFFHQWIEWQWHYWTSSFGNSFEWLSLDGACVSLKFLNTALLNINNSKVVSVKEFSEQREAFGKVRDKKYGAFLFNGHSGNTRLFDSPHHCVCVQITKTCFVSYNTCYCSFISACYCDQTFQTQHTQHFIFTY